MVVPSVSGAPLAPVVDRAGDVEDEDEDEDETG